MTKRFATRTWHPEPSQAQPAPQVQDPAVREVLLRQRRHFLALAADIARVCGIEDDEPSKASS